MTGRPKKKTPKRLAEAQRMKAEGWKVGRIAKAMGLSFCTIKSWLDQEYSEKRKARINASRRGEHKAASVHRIEAGRPDAATVARLEAQIPRDTRDLTGRLCGDPLPGRRAIDRKTVSGGA